MDTGIRTGKADTRCKTRSVKKAGHFWRWRRVTTRASARFFLGDDAMTSFLRRRNELGLALQWRSGLPLRALAWAA